MKDDNLLNEVNKAYESVYCQGTNNTTRDKSKKDGFVLGNNNDNRVFICGSDADRLMKPTSIRLKPSVKLKVEEMAKSEGRSFNNMVSRILESAVA